MQLETQRLILREYTLDDFDALFKILSDAETMQHYPAPFDQARTCRWIEWNLENYQKYGCGLLAVVLKETCSFIGDCGITLQNIDGQQLPEIGYHINKKYWRRGFAKEAARAVLDWVFENTDFDAVYSCMSEEETAAYWKNREYFEKILPVPPFYKDGNPDHATTWFKYSPQGQGIWQQMDFYRAMCKKYGLKLYRSQAYEAPGEIIYEDDFQIAVKLTNNDLKNPQ